MSGGGSGWVWMNRHSSMSNPARDLTHLGGVGNVTGLVGLLVGCLRSRTLRRHSKSTPR